MNLLAGTAIYRCKKAPGYVHLTTFEEPEVGKIIYRGKYYNLGLDQFADPINQEQLMLEGENPDYNTDILRFNIHGDCLTNSDFDLVKAVPRKER